MNIRFTKYIILVILLYSYKSPYRTQKSPEIEGYIKRFGLDSITKSDLFNKQFIQFTLKKLKSHKQSHIFIQANLLLMYKCKPLLKID